MNKVGQNRDAPAYQEYAASVMSRFEFRSLILEARGLLYTLRLECWVNQRLPSDPDILAKSLGLPTQKVKDLLPLLIGTFFQVTDGAIQCPELEDYRKTIQDRRNRQSEGGKKARAGGRNSQERLMSLESRVQLLSKDKRNPDQKNSVFREDESHEAWIRDYEGNAPENDK